MKPSLNSAQALLATLLSSLSACSIVEYCDFYTDETFCAVDSSIADSETASNPSGDGDGDGDTPGDGDGDTPGDGDGDTPGDGDGDGDTPGDGDPSLDPPEFSLELSPIKQFTFTWPEVTNAATYELFESVTVNAPLESLGLVDPGVALTVPLHLRSSASYYVRACTAMAQCSDSNTVEPADNLVPAIGYLVGEQGSTNAVYGQSIDVSDDGETLIVGAWGHAGPGGNDSGRAYVYERSGSEWLLAQTFVTPSGDANDRFGISVAISGDGLTIAVGADGDDSPSSTINSGANLNTGSDTGAVYIFVKQGQTWSTVAQAYVKATNTDDLDSFGGSVALSGDGNTLLVGARNEASGATGVGGDGADNSRPSSGAAYVYVRNQTVWSNQAYLKPFITDSGDFFGTVVALSADGNLALAGTPGDDSGLPDSPADMSQSFSGAVYAFARDGDVWQEFSYIKANNPGINDRFGERLSLSNDGMRLVVGASEEDGPNNLLQNAGAAYVFDHDGQGNWTQAAYLQASNAGAGYSFGDAVNISGDGNFIVVGSPAEDGSNPGVDPSTGGLSFTSAGAAYLFELQGNQWSEVVYIKAPSPEASDEFACAAALSSDTQLLAVGACFDDGPDDDTANTGAVFLY